jgi:hypothetical protein
MSGLAGRSYVTWYHELTGDWATWKPGDRVEPGTLGFFDSDQVFTHHYRKLADYGIALVVATAEQPGRSELVLSDDDFHLDFTASGQSSALSGAAGSLGAGFKATSKREHACILHMRDLSEAWIENVDAVLSGIKALLLSSKWDVRMVVVARRTEARQGFAAVSLGSGRSFEVKADGHARIAGAADLGSAGLLFAPGSGREHYLSWPFGPGSTPVFSSAIQVKHDLWDRLLPWRRDGGTLIGPDGRPYRELPGDLGGDELEARRYQPGVSAMSPEELSAMSVDDLFEEVTDLPDEVDAGQTPESSVSGRGGGRLLSFRLPVPPGRADLAAADPAEGAPPVGEVASPDGLTRFALFDRGDDEYWLEVSVTGEPEIPVIVRLRYTTTGRQRGELLVPVWGGSGSTSVVAVPGYDGGSWKAWPAVPVAGVWSASADLLNASVRAAVSSATVRAWERLASAAPEYSRRLIDQAIEEAGMGGR